MEVKEFELVKNIQEAIRDGAIIVSKSDAQSLMDSKAFIHLMSLLTSNYYAGILSLQKSARTLEEVRYAQGFLDAMESFIGLPSMILSSARDKPEPSVENETRTETVRKNLEEFPNG